MKKKIGKSISFFSLKGGVGKTILAVNMAGIFESLNKKVLIMDLDLSGGGVNMALNKVADKTIFNFVDDYNNNILLIYYLLLRILDKVERLNQSILK